MDGGTIRMRWRRKSKGKKGGGGRRISGGREEAKEGEKGKK